MLETQIRIKAVLSKTPMSMKDIMFKANLHTTCYRILRKFIQSGEVHVTNGKYHLGNGVPQFAEHIAAGGNPALEVFKEEYPAMVQSLEILEGLVEKYEEKSKRNFAELRITTPNNKVVKLKNTILPKCYEDILDLAKMRMNILLVGPAGCGKTTIGEMIGKSLGLDFSAMSFTAGMSETHLLGRSVPDLTTGKNRFESTEFIQRYEEGGVFLADEFDAADPNLLLCLNTATANNYLFLADRHNKPIAKRHPDFILIATANTYGRGATRMYAGRNQLDEATLDRFRIGMVEVDYDTILEEALCPHTDLRQTCWEVRKKIEEHGLRRVMSTRFLKEAYKMFKACDWSLHKIMSKYFQGWTPEEKEKAWVEPPKNKVEEEKKDDENKEKMETIEQQFDKLASLLRKKREDGEITKDEYDEAMATAEEAKQKDIEELAKQKDIEELDEEELDEGSPSERGSAGKDKATGQDAEYKPIGGKEAPLCPVIGHGRMVRMMSGKGWRCGVAGNKYTNGKWSVCNHAIWDSKPSFKDKLSKRWWTG